METPEINYDRALCSTVYRKQAHLWDAELDGSVKNAKAETPSQKKIRHAMAKGICNICPESLVCRWVGLNESGREGLYGGELVN